MNIHFTNHVTSFRRRHRQKHCIYSIKIKASLKYAEDHRSEPVVVVAVDVVAAVASLPSLANIVHVQFCANTNAQYPPAIRNNHIFAIHRCYLPYFVLLNGSVLFFVFKWDC